MTPLPAYFVEAIRANPDDDAPRLAAADWFAENGQPERGELIRAGVAMARHPDCPTLVADRKRGRPNPLRCGTCEYCTPRRACERLSYVRIWDGGPYAYLLGDVGWADIVAEIDQGDCPLFIVWRGFAERMCCNASIPLIPLIRTSRKTRSGGGPAFTISTPCSPLAASAIW